MNFIRNDKLANLQNEKTQFLSFFCYDSNPQQMNQFMILTVA